ncbi:pentatricopeptide repeat-containing protein At1g74600, chloroplastic [Gastrolobium bilobum]|uniref:pentatricopeptide repeat-containing protein At1g74600, chloroplastic n=1 Tax=Gastrolobium bilobum TaxID=150636 RepID=UPI002AAF4B9D|nr:pentatricopeptide repeat-containing protein At1g74600, chloroplastic [Gastrolobium bilobum]
MAVTFCSLRVILMNSLINKKLHRKSSQLACRFTSSLAFVQNPFVSCVQLDEKSTLSNPFEFLRDFKFPGKQSTRNTKILHAHLLKTHDLQSDIFFMNSLLDWYCKSADMVVAHKLFDTIALPNLVSWNIMISGYDHSSMFEKSLEMFCRMHLLGIEPDEFSYGSVLSACIAWQAPIFGMQVYSLVMKNGFLSNGYVQTRMMDMFSKNCNFKEALRSFYDASCDNVACWNAIISAAVKNGETWVALNLFRQMCCASLTPNSFTFPSILTACCVLKEKQIGEGVHGMAIKCGATDVFVETAIVDLYAKFGCMSEAFRQFSQMQVHNVVSWTAIISGFVQEDDIVSALKLFKDMRKIGQEINSYTFTSVLSACAKPGMIEEAGQIHSLLLKLGFSLDDKVGAALINMYAKIGEVGLSELAFSEMENMKDRGIWAAMLSSFAQSQNSGRAVELFLVMLGEGVKPDEYCISSVLSIMSCLNLGSQIHGYTLKSGLVTDVTLGCSLFTMYSKCGCLEESYKVFQQVLVKDNVSWASMISGFAEHGYADRALQLFKEMLYQEIVPDHLTLIPTLTACSALRFLQTGKEIHGYAFCLGMGTNTVVGGALVNMYSKCGSLNLARTVFDMLPQKDAFACSSLVSGYAQKGLIEESLLLFHDMLLTDAAVDGFTISSILGAAALLYRSEIGTQLHAYIEKSGLQADISVGSSLVTMYSKCGSIEDCHKAFDDAEKHDLIGWTSIIVSYAQHGKGAEALAAYELMRKEGVQPDAVTFVGILLACSHSGLVEEAFFYLNSMFEDQGIKPGHRHYACIVDLLGRSGRLREAEIFINKMPVEPDALIWGTLLAACKVNGDVELGKLAAKKVMELGPSDAGTYVSLSNICADVGQWEEVTKIRSSLNGTGMKKELAWSLL